MTNALPGLRKALVLVTALFCLFPAAHADEPAGAPAGSLQAVLDAGKLRVGVALYPPWAMRDADGELHGFEIDVAKKLASDLGVEPEFTVVVWDELMSTLEAGKVDILAAGLSITADRALRVNFSQPYASSGTGLATNLALTKDFDSLSDLDDPKVNIAVVTGTLSERLARSTFSKATFRPFESSDAAGKAVVAGDVHAFVVANPVPRFLELRNPDKVDVPLDEPLRITREAFAIRKGDADFLAFLNAWIVAHEADTWLQAHHDYWFKSLRWRTRNAGR